MQPRTTAYRARVISWPIANTAGLQDAAANPAQAPGRCIERRGRRYAPTACVVFSSRLLHLHLLPLSGGHRRQPRRRHGQGEGRRRGCYVRCAISRDGEEGLEPGHERLGTERRLVGRRTFVHSLIDRKAKHSLPTKDWHWDTNQRGSVCPSLSHSMWVDARRAVKVPQERHTDPPRTRVKTQTVDRE